MSSGKPPGSATHYSSFSAAFPVLRMPADALQSRLRTPSARLLATLRVQLFLETFLAILHETGELLFQIRRPDRAADQQPTGTRREQAGHLIIGTECRNRKLPHPGLECAPGYSAASPELIF